MKFTMPFGEVLEVRPSREVEEIDIAIDEEFHDVIYNIYWNQKQLPWHTKTRAEAIMIAFGCQWGASEAIKKAMGDWTQGN